jgi:hypothetical protein
MNMGWQWKWFFHFLQVTNLLMSFTPCILVPIEVHIQIPYTCTSCYIKPIQCTGVLKQFWFLYSSKCFNSAYERIHKVKLNLYVLFWKATLVVWLCKKTYWKLLKIDFYVVAWPWTEWCYKKVYQLQMFNVKDVLLVCFFVICQLRMLELHYVFICSVIHHWGEWSCTDVAVFSISAKWICI